MRRSTNLPSILLRSALWRSGFSSANFLRSTFAQTMNAFIGRRIRCSFRLLWAVLPGWHIFTPAGIGEIPCWYSSDGPDASQDMSSNRCCAGPLNIPGIYMQIRFFQTSFLNSDQTFQFLLNRFLIIYLSRSLNIDLWIINTFINIGDEKITRSLAY